MCVKPRKDISSYCDPVAIIHDKIGESHYVRIMFTFVDCVVLNETGHPLLDLFQFSRLVISFFPHYWFSESQPTSPTEVSWMTARCSEKISKS